MAPVPTGLQIDRYQSDLSNPDTATAQTLQVMCDQIAKAAGDKVLRRAARDAVQRFRGGPLYTAARVDPWRNPAALSESAWWWAKHALRFQLHDSMIRVWFNERDQLQLLISPDLLLRMSDPRGDCAIYTMLVCAMLRSFGIPFEIVTAAVTPNSPVYDHVWCRAVLPDGRRLNLDASHGKYPGWQVPLEHRTRTQVWNEQGEPIEDKAAFRGLHGYKFRPSRPILPKRLQLVPGVGLSGYRGLGDLTTVDESGNIIDSSGTVLGNVNTTPVATGVSLPSTSSGLNPFEQALVNAIPGAMTIVGRVVAPTTTIRGPGGTVVETPSSNAPSVLASTGFPAIGAANAGALLPILLIGGLGLFVVAMIAKK